VLRISNLTLFLTPSTEHFLDLVNADFSSQEEVVKLLDTWEERNPNNEEISVSQHRDVQDGVTGGLKRSFFDDLQVMFRRHSTMIVRDPILYLGRCLMIFITNLGFAFVYWKSRDYLQAQVVSKHFLNIWFVAVASNSKSARRLDVAKMRNTLFLRFSPLIVLACHVLSGSCCGVLSQR
jgi:hypothetical protein